ncbi:cobyrinate a,c-diamide synthase [Desulfolithobacter sp.]
MQKTNKVQGLVVAGMSGGSGKSVVSVGLVAALREAGKIVVPFKKGPDYIDAGWLTTAAGRPCYNLDPFLMDQEVITHSYRIHGVGAEYAIVEGNRGLYDGVNAEGGFSTAELALHLQLPVLLVVNCSKTTRTVAAQVLGCRELDRRVCFAGVILNQIATARHERIIRESMERYTDVPVLGIIPRMKRDIFPMRHLGVTPHQEYGTADEAVAQLARIARQHFDLEAITSSMRETVAPPVIKDPEVSSGEGVTIGILRDAAFQFYYEENLEALRRAGARLVMINALEAGKLPGNLDGLYIGGGFPETSARRLADNFSFRESVRTMAEKGLPMYAECGGLIFLGRSIILDGREYPLAGVFPVTFGLSEKPQAHGYSIFTVERENPFYPVGTRVKGHEFRYSTIMEWDGTAADLALRIDRGTGFMDKRDGLIKNNVMALYTHVLAPGTPLWAEGLVRRALHYKHSVAR